MFKDLINANVQIMLRQDIKHGLDDTYYIIGTLLNYSEKFVKIKNIVNNEICLINIDIITFIFPAN